MTSRPTAGRRVARLTWLAGALALALGLISLLLLGPGTGSAQARFALGLQDDGFLYGASSAQSGTAYGAMGAIHGSYVRIPLEWSDVVKSASSPQPPSGFNQANPGDPSYGFDKVDAAVRAAAAHHLQAILVIDRAPTWALGPGPVKPNTTDGAWNPNLAMFTQLVHAVARRYSGSYPDPANAGSLLPRVRYWEPWNEPNIPGYLNAPNLEAAYRNMLNAAYGQLKGVHRDNVVMLGGLAPVSPVAGSIPPLDFAAAMMCMRPAGSGFVAVGGCKRANFDALAAHPYSIAATPTKHAYKRGDLLVGDIGRLHTLIRAAGHHYPLWVTEFSWYTNPPNTQIGDAPLTAARYVDYSLYEMWKAGVSVVIWFKAIDSGGNDTYSGGGLYAASGQPKPDLSAFGFPFVAGRGWAWGRVPASGARTVSIERSSGSRWIRVATARTGSDGVFYVRFAGRGNHVYRARVSGGPTSLSYDSRPIPPRRTHLFTIT